MAQLNPQRMAFVSSIGNGYKTVGFFYPSSAPEIKGVVQICHGMAEYVKRYEEMILKFNEAGYHVCGMDMPGHGETYQLNKENGYPKGYFGGGKEPWRVLLTDVMGFHEYAEKRFGREGLKYILYGHSMGSFVARSIFSTPRYNRQFDGYVFASTMGPNPAVGMGKALANLGCVFGKKAKNGLLNAIAFGSYNKRIKKPRTACDWLSTIPEEVDKYVNDPMCGFTFTSDGFKTLFGLVGFIQSEEAYALIPDRPCFFTYGEDDPVGSYGEGVRKVIARMQEAGANLKSKSYGPYRHEIQNEPVKEEYFKDLIDFFDSVPLS